MYDITWKELILNFRDLAKKTSKIKPNLIYRSSHLAPHCKESYFKDFRKEYPFKTILDLRWPTETNRFPYSQDFLKHILYENFTLIDTPLNKKDWSKFIPYNEKGDFYEVIPKYFKSQIKGIFETLIFAETPIIIHCWSGKDRTGIIVALILMLLDTPEEEIISDYLETGLTTTKEKIQPLIDFIKRSGGINSYLLSTGLTSSQLNQVILKYKK